MYNTLSNKCETDTNTDKEIITINKSKLIDYIVNLVEVAFILGVCIGATITQLIIRFC